VTLEIGIRVAILVFVMVLVVGLFWWGTRIRVDPNANHDRWKDPDQGGGTGMPPFGS